MSASFFAGICKRISDESHDFRQTLAGVQICKKQQGSKRLQRIKKTAGARPSCTPAVRACESFRTFHASLAAAGRNAHFPPSGDGINGIASRYGCMGRTA
jgi:hypothetical protein